MPDYFVGSVVTKARSFSDQNDVLVDPSSVAVTVKAPDGTATAIVPTRVSTGIYKFTFAPTQVGWHSVDWKALA